MKIRYLSALGIIFLFLFITSSQAHAAEKNKQVSEQSIPTSLPKKTKDGKIFSIRAEGGSALMFEEYIIDLNHINLQ